ncbi:hypothetical protein FOZ63_023189 [Perkinsus olseni]|uniref:Uncharacterized protein n=1 Tax=Perkinsus olseni TaxID=32597 RepID=A0A7J6R524_PEROL|nr:hypothetical protein FOZ63_023189 [Perkinsus olseni]KAF4735726.1 hypothetical protein FOZ62_003361 [Perkinsus olseni]
MAAILASSRRLVTAGPVRAGLLRRGTANRMRVAEDIEFTKNRYTRRYNLATEDRVKLLNWNVFCIAATVLPFAYVYYSWYETSEDTDMIYRTMDPMKEVRAEYYLPLLRGH